jgi:hypothetical protein
MTVFKFFCYLSAGLVLEILAVFDDTLDTIIYSPLNDLLLIVIILNG